MIYTLIINEWLDKFLRIDFQAVESIWTLVRTVDVYILDIYLISLVILITAIVMGCICFQVLLTISLTTNDVTHICICLLDNLCIYFIQVHLLHGCGFLFTVLLLSLMNRVYFLVFFHGQCFLHLILKIYYYPKVMNLLP